MVTVRIAVAADDGSKVTSYACERWELVAGCLVLHGVNSPDGDCLALALAAGDAIWSEAPPGATFTGEPTTVHLTAAEAAEQTAQLDELRRLTPAERAELHQLAALQLGGTS